MEEEDSFEVRARVHAVIPEFHQAMLITAEGAHHTITRFTEGVSLAELREGEVYLLKVVGRFRRVVFARRVDV